MVQESALSAIFLMYPSGAASKSSKVIVLSRASRLMPSRTASAHFAPACLRSPMRKRGALKYSLMIVISSTSLLGVLKAMPSRFKKFLKAYLEPPHVLQL